MRASVGIDEAGVDEESTPGPVGISEEVDAFAQAEEGIDRDAVALDVDAVGGRATAGRDRYVVSSLDGSGGGARRVARGPPVDGSGEAGVEDGRVLRTGAAVGAEVDHQDAGVVGLHAYQVVEVVGVGTSSVGAGYGLRIGVIAEVAERNE